MGRSTSEIRLHRAAWSAHLFSFFLFPFSCFLLPACGSDRPALAGDMAPVIVARAAEAPAVTRMQKEDSDRNETIRRTIFNAVTEPFPATPDGPAAVRIRAQVNGFPILDEEVREACLPFLPHANTDAEKVRIFRDQLEQIIDREVVLDDLFKRFSGKRAQVLDKLKEAAAKDFEKQIREMKKRSTPPLKTDDDVKKLLQSQGITYEGYRRQCERTFMAREYMHNRIWPQIERIGHQQIVEYYEQHASEFQAEDAVEWQDLFIDTALYRSREEARHVAEEVAARARRGDDFAQLSGQFDNGISKYNKGEGIGHKRGEVKPTEAEAVLFGLHDGEVGPVIELGNGFHVVRLVKREYAGRQPLTEKVQDEIRKKLQNEVADREMKRMLADLKRKATIEIASDP
jgi:parvulin-like peptidyl-prolyl isomerase